MHNRFLSPILWVYEIMMEIEFDPAKEAENIAKHGVSLQATEGFDWDTAFEREDDRLRRGPALSPWG